MTETTSLLGHNKELSEMDNRADNLVTSTRQFEQMATPYRALWYESRKIQATIGIFVLLVVIYLIWASNQPIPAPTPAVTIQPNLVIETFE